MPSTCRNTRNRRGSALFLILLAVVLFAALYVAVTGSDRGNKDASTEKIGTLVGELSQNFALIENTITREMLINGTSPYGFDFAKSGITNAAANATCTNSNCRLFNQIPIFEFPSWSLTVSGIYYFNMIRIIDVGTNDPELVMFYSGSVTPSVCAAINKAFDASEINYNNAESFEWSPDYNSSRYTGTLTSMPLSFGVLGDTNTSLKGKKTFCVYSEGNLRVFHVLLAR